MTKLGEYLRAIIDRNKINVYMLAKTAGIERTQIHKIMNGTRLPAMEYMYKLAEVLQLSPVEKEQFFESYNIAKIGEHKYKQRLQVKSIIEKMAEIERFARLAAERAEHNSSEHEPIPDGTIFNGQFAVNALINNILDNAALCEEGARLDFIIPETNQYFYDELLKVCLRYPELQIRHIVGFSKKVEVLGSDEFKNLKILAQIMPFAYISKNSYAPYYYYQESAQPDPTLPMPYFVLTGGALALFSKDFDKAIYVVGGMQQVYEESFETLLEKSAPLFTRISDNLHLLKYFYGIYSASRDFHHCCIGADKPLKCLLTDEQIDQYAKQDLPNREHLYDLAVKHWAILRQIQRHAVTLGTIDDLVEIIKTGYVIEGSEDIFNPIPSHLIKEMVIHLKNMIEDDNAKIFFANPSKITLPKHIQFSINRACGTHIGVYSNHHPEIFVLHFQEESITDAFVDFIENIEESGLIYNRGDTLAALEEISRP